MPIWIDFPRCRASGNNRNTQPITSIRHPSCLPRPAPPLPWVLPPFLPPFDLRTQVAAFLRHHQGNKYRKGGGAGAAGDADNSDNHDTYRWLGWAGEGREGDGSGGLPFGFYLDLDALHVARAAARCGAHCSALFYAEASYHG